MLAHGSTLEQRGVEIAPCVPYNLTRRTLETHPKMNQTNVSVQERSRQTISCASRVSVPDFSPNAWEAAYARFETPEQEIRKFTSRLRKLQIDKCQRDAAVVELFCGRGNGLEALRALGFVHAEGVDLSPRLLAQYRGRAVVLVADCCRLPFANCSKDILIVQGGLHHLPVLPDDLDRAFGEMRRVLCRNGRLVIVEPWPTPFLTFMHAISRNPLGRLLSKRLDAFATMVEHERATYERWLSQSEMILNSVRAHFAPLREFFRWGKWNFVGQPKQ